MVDSGEKPDQSEHDGDDSSKDAQKQTAESETHEPANAEKSDPVMTLQNFVSILFTGATVICTLLLVVSSFMTFGAICIQAFIYNAQLKEMEKSTQAATKAAKAAQDGIALAKETAHIDQRAWVSTFNVPVSERPKDGEKWRIKIPFRNSGKTFARNVDITCGLHLIRKGNEPDFDTKADETAPVNNLLLPPNGEYAMSFLTDVLFSEETTTKPIIAGDWRAMVWGEITYLDIFDCPHWTKFCFVVDPSDWIWNIYKEHNDADNDRCRK